MTMYQPLWDIRNQRSGATYEQLNGMTMAELVDRAFDHPDPQERLKAREAAMMRVPLWDGRCLDREQLSRLKTLCDITEVKVPACAG